MRPVGELGVVRRVNDIVETSQGALRFLCPLPVFLASFVVNTLA